MALCARVVLLGPGPNVAERAEARAAAIAGDPAGDRSATLDAALPRIPVGSRLDQSDAVAVAYRVEWRFRRKVTSANSRQDDARNGGKWRVAA